MAHVAYLPAGLLSRKGWARPMPVQGPEYRCSNQGHVTWHTASPAHLPLTVPAPAPARRGRAKAARPKQDRVRVSIRLTRDLHCQLKTLSAIAERSQQSILVQALNEFLVYHEEHLEHAGDRRFPVPG